jgi:penicillin-binding protein 1A
VKLSIALGNGNPKIGRAKIIQTARKMGIRSPLNDTPSLPIGAAEVTVLDHTGAYATFPNLGKAVAPHAVLEMRTGPGELIWRFDRDGKKPEQVIRPQVALEMNQMMNKVVEEGTGRRAILDGIKSAGKTGTTNAYRDAWFVGFTGNYVSAVWVGNDDYAPTRKMTGGSLPAMIWHDIMAYAHQGVELKNIPGVAPGPPSSPPPAGAEAPAASAEVAPRPALLTRRAADILQRVEHMMDDATRALASTPAAATGQSGAGVRPAEAFAASGQASASPGN